MDKTMYLYIALVAIVISYSQVDAADGTASSGQVPEFHDKRIRPLEKWMANLTQELTSLWPEYAQQILSESQIANSLSQYADAITADNDYIQTCITEHKNKYTQLKLQAITDYRACVRTQALSISESFTADSQAVLRKLSDLDKKFTYITERCKLDSPSWHLNSFIRTLRDLCHIVSDSAMNKELRNFRDSEIMNLYRQALLMVVNNGKQLGSCIAKASAASINTIDTNTQDIAKCVNR